MSVTPNRGGTWPAVAYESVPWDVHPVSGMPRQDRAMLGRPYRAAVLAPIAELDLSLSGGVAAEVEEAAGEARLFDAEAGRELAPFTAMLLRTESAASSQIEQLSASARKIAEAEVTGAGTAHAEMIVANVQSMRAALELADHLDGYAILAMHETLMRRSVPQIAGRWREDQVWIGGRARAFGPGTPHDADFVPPVAARIEPAIADLVAFLARVDLPALAQTALAHAQFETIHPFPDGNGRVGRALVQAMLRAKGVAHHVSVPVSAGLLTDTKGYFRALTAYREGGPEMIVSTLARATMLGVANGRELIADLECVRAGWKEKLSGIRADSGARRLADGLLRYPVVSVTQVREVLAASPGQNVHRHIDVLVQRGILKHHQDDKPRNQTWRAPDILNALDRYADRAGRRRR
ncbi:MAG: Fic family protein [Ornithinimicrobium sp.]|uniref:Fic family protein n=1 Tax=Ornithinimicrobium sp. TaxID=1977084 RepID=UPI003D9ACFE1